MIQPAIFSWRETAAKTVTPGEAAWGQSGAPSLCMLHPPVSCISRASVLESALSSVTQGTISKWATSVWNSLLVSRHRKPTEVQINSQRTENYDCRWTSAHLRNARVQKKAPPYVTLRELTELSLKHKQAVNSTFYNLKHEKMYFISIFIHFYPSVFASCRCLHASAVIDGWFGFTGGRRRKTRWLTITCIQTLCLEVKFDATEYLALARVRWNVLRNRCL